MARYVDVVALRDALYDADAVTMKGVAIINQFPTADVVEVVRCRECKYYTKNPWGDDKMCQLWVDWLPTDPDDFCSYGAKMDGDAE